MKHCFCQKIQKWFRFCLKGDLYDRLIQKENTNAKKICYQTSFTLKAGQRNLGNALCTFKDLKIKLIKMVSLPGSSFGTVDHHSSNGNF